MCKALLDNGIKCLHFYTLNLEKSVSLILQGLGLIDAEIRRPLPWNPVISKFLNFYLHCIRLLLELRKTYVQSFGLIDPKATFTELQVGMSTLMDVGETLDLLLLATLQIITFQIFTLLRYLV
jgi:hypothetical protein